MYDLGQSRLCGKKLRSPSNSVCEKSTPMQRESLSLSPWPSSRVAEGGQGRAALPAGAGTEKQPARDPLRHGRGGTDGFPRSHPARARACCPDWPECTEFHARLPSKPGPAPCCPVLRAQTTASGSPPGLALGSVALGVSCTRQMRSLPCAATSQWISKRLRHLQVVASRVQRRNCGVSSE